MCYVSETEGKIFDRSTYDVGRVTNPKTRPILMTDYKQAINKGFITEMDERIKAELYTFIYNDKMKEEAQIGHHDDGIMADAIGWQMRKTPLAEY